MDVRKICANAKKAVFSVDTPEGVLFGKLYETFDNNAQQLLQTALQQFVELLAQSYRKRLVWTKRVRGPNETRSDTNLKAMLDVCLNMHLYLPKIKRKLDIEIHLPKLVRNWREDRLCYTTAKGIISKIYQKRFLGKLENEWLRDKRLQTEVQTVLVVFIRDLYKEYQRRLTSKTLRKSFEDNRKKLMKLDTMFDTIFDLARGHRAPIPVVFAPPATATPNSRFDDDSIVPSTDTRLTLQQSDLVAMSKASNSANTRCKMVDLSWLRRNIAELQMFKLQLEAEI